MTDEFDTKRVRQALGQLTADEPALGFNPLEVVTAGRNRRRRHNVAVGGMSAAAAVAVVTAIVVPAALRSPAPSAPPDQIGTSAQPSVVTPSPSASSSPKQSGSYTCTRPTDAQWNSHLAFEAKLQTLLANVNGKLTSDFNREDTACSTVGSVWLEARLRLTRAKSVGSVGAMVSTTRGGYRNFADHDPCSGAPPSGCTMSRRGDVLIQVSRLTENGSHAQPSRSTAVTAIWPDDTEVTVLAATTAHPEQTPPPLASVPLTDQQLIALALDPQLRS